MSLKDLTASVLYELDTIDDALRNFNYEDVVDRRDGDWMAKLIRDAGEQIRQAARRRDQVDLAVDRAEEAGRENTITVYSAVSS